MTKDNRKVKRKDGKSIFWGVLFILASLLIIVNQLGFFKEISMFKIISAVLLIGIMIRSIYSISFPGILYPMAFLCIIFEKELNISEFVPWPALLTATLASIGLSLVFKKNYNGKLNFHRTRATKTVGEESESVIDCYVNFGAITKYIHSNNFESAKIKCSFGAASVYFDQAIINSDEAYIDLDVSFGGVELFIPKEWRVTINANVSLGGIEEKFRVPNASGPTVYITGNVNLSGVEIIYI